MRRLILLAACVLCAGVLRAADFSSDARGTTAAGFLKLGAGARAAGLGDAQAAVADDASALYWNPAGLSRIEGSSLVLMHAPYLVSTQFDFAAFAQRFDENTFGASVQYFSAGPIARRSDSNGDLGSYQPYDLALTLGYARRLDDTWRDTFNLESAGVSAKLIQSKILHTAQTTAVDVGFLSVGYFEDRLHLGYTAANIGGTLKYEQVAERLPLTFRVGAAFLALPEWTLALDGVFPRDNAPHAAFGTEYRGGGEDLRWAVRAGVNTRTLGDVGGLTGVSVGVGASHEGIGLDYALVPFGDLGLSHRISLSLAFGEK